MQATPNFSRGHRVAGCTLWAAWCLLPAGCAIPPAPAAKEVMDPHLAGQIPDNWRATSFAGHPDNDWVRSFNDAKLNRLVAQALAHNPALAVAEANVDASRAGVRIAGARLYP